MFGSPQVTLEVYQLMDYEMTHYKFFFLFFFFFLVCVLVGGWLTISSVQCE